MAGEKSNDNVTTSPTDEAVTIMSSDEKAIYGDPKPAPKLVKLNQSKYRPPSLSVPPPVSDVKVTGIVAAGDAVAANAKTIAAIPLRNAFMLNPPSNERLANHSSK